MDKKPSAIDAGLTQLKPETAASAPVPGKIEPMAPQIDPRVSNGPPKQSLVMSLKEQFGKRKKLFVGLGIALAVLLLALIIPGVIIFGQGKKVYASAKGVQAAVAAQDIAKIKSSLDALKGDLNGLKGSYGLLGWTQIIPFAGGYWSDGNAAIRAGLYGIDAGKITLDTIEPYADLIGFKGNGDNAANGEETAKDRIDFIVKTVGEIAPKLDSIAEKTSLAQKELAKIDPNRYPENWGKVKLKSKIRESLSMAEELSQALVDAKPLLAQAPYLLGIDSERTYLLIFQNDKELRPTGGFITGYSVMSVNKGKVDSVSSNDIYNLDKVYKPSIAAPEPIIKYIKGPYILNPNLRLRDMNFDPDFKVSMDIFAKEVQKAGLNNFDGVVAVDTYVLVKILNVLGQIGVPGYGNFNTNIDPECNCPQVVHELEAFADVEGAVVWSENEPGKIVFAPPNYENRKKIIGPLMNSVLANALGQPKDKIPGLAQAAWESLTEKHVLLYLFDEKAQKAVESFNIAGRVKSTPEGGDYLLINDSNLGGRKSNLYVSQEVSQEVNIKADGSVEKTLNITYKNNQDHDGWLNSVLPNWTRIYVPKGSSLISVDGFEDKAEPYEESGKTVFAGGFKLRPQGVVKITVKYKLPNKVKGEYRMLVQKQPGLDAPLYTIKVKRQLEEYLLKTDHLFKFRI